MSMFKTKKKKKKEKKSSGLHAAHEFLVSKEGGEKTLKELIGSDQLVIGAYPEIMNNPDMIRNELNALIKNEGIWNFANNQSLSSRRGAVAFGPPSYLIASNMAMLEEHAPTLNRFVKFIEVAYDKTDKVLTGLWWTYYRSETDLDDVVVVKCGVMKPHRDRITGKITDRVIATLGCNTKGGQKRMSFEYSGKPKSKVWIDIHHGMFICLSKESSGNDKFNDKYVKHGVEGAEGTWTITMEFSLRQNA
mmetsp:Transcript_4187/g.8754  ORF Transcript_4187/g.8754 Transcript_4187/m.8754 type:complete len:248 (-) Transcript_4187:33-776(-)